MYEFHGLRDDLNSFIAGLELPPFPPGVEPGPNGETPENTGELPPPLDFDQIKDFLPPTFLPPEYAAAAFDYFGQNNPLIGQDQLVNPDLEVAAFDHPPTPPGFQAFDFTGDCPQFDDLFTVYDQNNVGVPMKGQVNTTFTTTDVDGNTVNCSETTLVDVLLGEALPFVDMGDGIVQTQWVVDVHQVRNAHFVIEDPAEPGVTEEFDETVESFSQVTWTMLVQDVDTDGDGVVDQVLITGSNTIELLDTIADGSGPELQEPAPDLVLPFEFDTVLNVGEATTGEETVADGEAVEDATVVEGSVGVEP